MSFYVGVREFESEEHYKIAREKERLDWNRILGILNNEVTEEVAKNSSNSSTVIEEAAVGSVTITDDATKTEEVVTTSENIVDEKIVEAEVVGDESGTIEEEKLSTEISDTKTIEKFTEEQLWSFKKSDLVELATNLGLDSVGVKESLIERILQKYEDSNQ